MQPKQTPRPIPRAEHPIKRQVLDEKLESLAKEIATSFGEADRLPLYRVYCRNYDESLLRRAWSEAKSWPDEKIRKSKSALFFYLVKKYAQEEN